MAITGFKGKLQVNDGASNAYTDFSGVVTVSIPSGECKVAEFSTINQSDRYVQKLPTMINPGQLTAELIYTKADYARLVALIGKKYHGSTTATAVSWKIISPDEDGTTVTLLPMVATFAGILTKYETDLDTDNVSKIKLTVEVSGAIAITDGTNEA